MYNNSLRDIMYCIQPFIFVHYYMLQNNERQQPPRLWYPFTMPMAPLVVNLHTSPGDDCGSLSALKKEALSKCVVEQLACMHLENILERVPILLPLVSSVWMCLRYKCLEKDCQGGRGLVVGVTPYTPGVLQYTNTRRRIKTQTIGTADPC